MVSLTKNEEDYLKALFHLTFENDLTETGTKQLPDYLGLTAASVNGMLKKLRSKKLVNYKKYGKLSFSKEGEHAALLLIRKHRLWETFLSKYMQFTWDEVHEVAEQLEHIKSKKLIDELDNFLGHPTHDPHGSPIPDAQGNYEINQWKKLSECPTNQKFLVASVKDSTSSFLQYLSQLELGIGSDIVVLEVHEFDGSRVIRTQNGNHNVSLQFAENLYVKKG